MLSAFFFFLVQRLKETKGFTVCLNFMSVSWAELKTRTTFVPVLRVPELTTIFDLLKFRKKTGVLLQFSFCRCSTLTFCAVFKRLFANLANNAYLI